MAMFLIRSVGVMLALDALKERVEIENKRRKGLKGCREALDALHVVQDSIKRTLDQLAKISE